VALSGTPPVPSCLVGRNGERGHEIEDDLSDGAGANGAVGDAGVRSSLCVEGEQVVVGDYHSEFAKGERDLLVILSALHPKLIGNGDIAAAESQPRPNGDIDVFIEVEAKHRMRL
jgi:hypothetical protein